MIGFDEHSSWFEDVNVINNNLVTFDRGLAVLLHVLPMLAMAGRWHTTEFSLNVSAMAMAMAVPVVCLGS